MDEQEKILPMGAGVFLMIVGGFTDLLQAGLDLVLIGLVLGPVISFIVGIIFAVTLNHWDIPMLRGKWATSGWIALITEFIPGFDIVPGWFLYAAYLTFYPRAVKRIRSIIGAS